MIVVNANNFPKYDIQEGTVFEKLFLIPDGVRTRYCIGWQGVGRYTAGTLRIWKKGLSLAPAFDFTENANGLFFEFAVPPAASDSINDYLIGFVPRPDDLAFSKGTSGDYLGEEYFLFPNWLEAGGVGDGFWLAKYLASKNTATSTGEGLGSVPTSRKNVVPWCNLTATIMQSSCLSKGTGFRIPRNREWSNVALWCKHHNIYPAGNSASGSDGMGVAGTADPTVAGRTLTGTGATSWNHNLMDSGISDLVGNVLQLTDGVKYISNVLYVYDATNTLINTGVSPAFGTSGGSFNLLRTDEALKHECIPATGAGTPIKGSDGFWFAAGDMVLYRGGYWGSGALDGLFAFSVYNAASNVYAYCGFRLARDLQS